MPKIKSRRIRRLASRYAALPLVATSVILVGSTVSGADAAESASTSSSTLEEVIVTARKRNENVQDIPVTIDVLSGARLAEQGVLRANELQFAVPGFYVQNYETRATISMRGVGSQIAGGTSSVATHVDGIYQSSSAAQLNRLFDVERVEVLKGPQGTLYGRNSTGGALNIITRAPGKTAEGDLSVGYGRYDTVRVDGGVTVPLSDDWSLRAAGSYLKGDGRITNIVTGRKIGNDDFKGGRLTLAGDAGPVKVSVFAQYSQDKDNRQPTLIPVTVATGQPRLGWDVTALDNPTEATIDRKNFLTGVTLSGDLGGGYTWRSITGYIDYKDASNTDVNPQPNSAVQLFIQFPQFAKQFSQEFQLLYAGSDWNWVLGGYYLHDDQSNKRYLELDPGALPLFDNSGQANTRAYALFADANYKLTDKLTLNLGARWNRDKVRNVFVGNGLIDGAGFDLSSSESKPTGRIGLDYTIHEGLMVYGSVATGFQAGFNETKFDPLSGADAANKVNAEKLTAFELGLKSILPGERGFFNLAAFYYDYRDMQVQVGGLFLLPDGSLDPTQPPFFYTANAGKARIYGLDLQLSEVRLADHLKADVTAEYLSAKYRDYATVADDRTPINYKGNTLPRAPKFTATSALTVDRLPLGPALGSIRLEYNYRSKTYFSQDNTQLASQGALGLVNATARVEFNDGRWALTAAGRNLTDKHFYDFNNGGSFANVGEFRTWEIGANYRFR